MCYTGSARKICLFLWYAGETAPYYQYIIGLHGFFNEAPYVPSLLVEFSKRLDDEILAEINEMLIAYNTPDDSSPGSGGDIAGGL